MTIFAVSEKERRTWVSGQKNQANQSHHWRIYKPAECASTFAILSRGVFSYILFEQD